MISLRNKLLIYFSLILTIEAKTVVFTDVGSHLPSDFEYQREYESESHGAQVISLGMGHFHAVLFLGGYQEMLGSI